MPLISVIVPVYKVELYLRRCVDSILSQTFTDFELILVEDGSPDNCGTICDGYSESDKRVHVIHQKNGGLSAARNAGIEWVFSNSNSDWISFIDSDDWVHENYLEYLHKAALDVQAEMSSCEMLCTNGELSEYINVKYSVEEMDSSTYFKYYANGNSIVAWAKLYKKELFKTVRYPVGRIHEDEFTTPKLIFSCNQIAVLHMPLYYYYQNQQGITHQEFSIRNYDRVLAREERINLFKQLNKNELVEKDINDNVFECAIFSLAARKAGIYDQVLKRHKVRKLRAIRIIKNRLNEDQYENLMFQYYPHYIKLRSAGKKLYRIIFKRH